MVELNGEGYFEVTKNAKKPFIVKTQLFNIQVLGTRFNVFAYAGKESKFETCLVEGRVLVYNKIIKRESLSEPTRKSIVSKQPHGSVYFQLRQ